MKRIKTLETRDLCASVKNGGCGECQTSCQSACKTSCGIANQACEKKNNDSVVKTMVPPLPGGIFGVEIKYKGRKQDDTSI